MYNLQGKLVETLIENEFMSNGRHSINWKVESLPSGIYIAKLSNNDLSISTKVMLIK